MANLADPGRHGVRARRAVVRVDDDDSDDDGGDDKNHGEEHVFPDQGDSAGGGGDQLHNDQQEDGQGQQDGDGQGHLLAWRGGRTARIYQDGGEKLNTEGKFSTSQRQGKQLRFPDPFNQNMRGFNVPLR